MARRKAGEQAARGRTRLFAVPREAIPWAVSRPRPENHTPLRGRRELPLQITTAFDSGARLVTLVGTAGVGKTRLADHVVLAPPFAATVGCFCSLDEARTTAEALAVVAAALGVTASAADEDERQVAALGASLRRLGEAVIVLDGVDPVGPAAVAMLAAWRDHAPRARFLVTSRQPLRVGGEVVVDVPPLSCDEAVALFVDHARLVRRDFLLTGDAQRAVEQIVELLDCVPLAVELAAARTVLLSPTEILERLADGREPLPSPIERAISMSWDLLAGPERECLAQCAVFRGGFGVEAAERVVVLEPEGDRDAIVDVVARLVDRSLLRRLSSRRGADRTRLVMYASVRAFADLELDALGRRADVEARHERYFIEQGARWLQGLDGPGVADCRARLLEEQPNLLEAFGRAQGARPEAVVQLARIASPVLSSFGPPSLHLGMLDVAVAVARGLDSQALARVLALRGWARLHRGHARAAESDLEEALVAAREARDPSLEIDALAKLGHLRLRVGRIDDARPVIDDALRLCRETRQERLLGQVLARVALLRLFTGDPRSAEDTFTAALEEHERHDDLLWMAFSYSGRGAVRMERGATQPALADFAQALRLEERLGDQRVVGVVSVNLGLIRHEEGDLDEAVRLLETGLATLEQVGHRRGEGEAQEALGVLALDRGLFVEAERHLLAAQDIYGRMGHAVGEGRVHAILGACAARTGHAGIAEQHFRIAREGLDKTPEGRLELPLVAIFEALLGGVSPPASSTPAIAHRIAARVVARAHGASGPSPRPEATPSLRVTFEPACRWFEVAGQKRVSLAKRGAMRLVLERLVALRLAQPGQTVDVYALFEAAWPGDKASPDVGAARVYESIRILRRMGLNNLLLHRDGGYLIDPQVEVAVAHSKSTP